MVGRCFALSANSAWSAFWRNQPVGAAGCLAGAPEAVAKALRAAWEEFARNLPRSAAVLDIATGDGAVPRIMARRRTDLRIDAVDQAEIPPRAGPVKLTGCVDAAALPFADQMFAGVTSQFGIEYCGPTALIEAVRVLAPGGHLRFVCHHEASEAVRHNRARLAALRAMSEAGLFAAARRACAGLPADALAQARIARIMTLHASQGIVRELPGALAQVIGRPGGLAAVATIEARSVEEDLRITAMLDAALARDAAQTMTERLAALGLAVRCDTLTVQGRPFAWLIDGALPG